MSSINKKKMKVRLLSSYYSFAPDSWIYAEHKARHANAMDVWCQSCFLFLHVPKAAGTSINRALDMPDLGHLLFKDIAPKINVSKKRLFFCVYRDPIDRLWSTFNYAHRQYKSKGFTSLMKVVRFKSFEHFISEGVNDRLLQHYFFSPVCEFVRYAPKDRTYILSFSEIERAYGMFAEEFGLPPGLPHTNKSVLDRRCSNQMDSDLVKKVHSLYANDMKIGNKLASLPFIRMDSLK